MSIRTALQPRPATTPQCHPRPLRRLRRSAASVAVLNLMALALNQPAQAISVYWAGGEGNWMSNIAWVGGLVPNYWMDKVYIDDLINPAITSKVHLNTSVGVGQVFIGAGDELRIQQGSLSLYGGLLSNNGTLTLAATSNGWGHMQTSADTTLAGSGTTVLASDVNSGHRAVIAGNGNLTIGSGHTLRGHGDLGNTSFGTQAVVNQGTLIAEGGTVNLYQASDKTFNNSAGLIQIAANGTLLQTGGKVTGGLVQGLGSGAKIGGSTFADLVLAGPLAVSGNLSLANTTIQHSLSVAAATLYTSGTITNNGTLTLAGTSNGWGRMVTSADTTLAGSGTTVLASDVNSGYRAAIAGSSGILTIGSGHTLRGHGDLGNTSFGTQAVVNQGTLIAEGGVINLYPGIGKAFDNSAGKLRIDETGAASVSGTLLLGDASLLSFDIASAGGLADHGLLTLQGITTFDGTLLLNFEGYTPTVGEQFRLIDFSGNHAGAFDAASSNGFTLSLSYANSEVVATVTGVSAVPEPQTWALWLIGLVALGGLARRRARQG